MRTALFYLQLFNDGQLPKLRITDRKKVISQIGYVASLDNHPFFHYSLLLPTTHCSEQTVIYEMRLMEIKRGNYG